MMASAIRVRKTIFNGKQKYKYAFFNLETHFCFGSHNNFSPSLSRPCTRHFDPEPYPDPVSEP
jgi:hypothetical protein